MKTCTKCKEEKPFEEFGKYSRAKDGLKSQCKQCIKKYQSKNKEYYDEYNKEYRLKNKDKIAEQNKQYKLKNKEYYKEYYLKNKEKISKQQKEYQIKNKEKINKYAKTYIKEFRKKYPHIHSWRRLLQYSLNRLGKSKQSKTIDLLGYSAIDLKHHLEALFIEGMTWDNRSEWHIDHIVPVSAFKKDTPPHIVNKLENLRPVWAVENLSKGGKVYKEEISEDFLEYIEI